VKKDARVSGHRMKSRVIQEALELLKARRDRQAKYLKTAA
jgi:hypothetical protein